MPHPGPELHVGEIEAIARKRVGLPLRPSDFEGTTRVRRAPRIGRGPTISTLQTPVFTTPAPLSFDPVPFVEPLGRAGCDRLTGIPRDLCLAALGAIFQPGPGVPEGQGLTVPCPPSIPGCPGHDPTPGVLTPAERSLLPADAAVGLQAPFAIQRTVLQCPVFGNGKVGILWMSMLNGQIVCLPRGVSGAGFGLVRKNKPPTKPLFTGGDVNCLRRAGRLQKKAKKIDKIFASLGTKRGR